MAVISRTCFLHLDRRIGWQKSLDCRTREIVLKFPRVALVEVVQVRPRRCSAIDNRHTDGLVSVSAWDTDLLDSSDKTQTCGL